ncbi:L,D-transpeptidase [Metabacillus niabensis]|uniref:L,D-transpeptidase n=1 Tax=Metabacillus niabensis TaxID=324854 RepID=UPI001CFBB53D|nr:L,D-transpeptidase [Metabacillus niabensis]
MRYLLLFLFIVQSPIWPLGENPVPGDPYLIINKHKNEMAFVHENEIKEIYQVATGITEELTPEGEFTVTVKAVDPYYRKKDIPGGDKRNPLGTRWIGFDAEGTDGRTYGIHGTNNDKSIGSYVTQGCVRLQNKKVEDIYENVPLGTKVFITNSDRSFEQLAIENGAIQKESAPQ